MNKTFPNALRIVEAEKIIVLFLEWPSSEIEIQQQIKENPEAIMHYSLRLLHNIIAGCNKN